MFSTKRVCAEHPQTCVRQLLIILLCDKTHTKHKKDTNIIEAMTRRFLNSQIEICYATKTDTSSSDISPRPECHLLPVHVQYCSGIMWAPLPHKGRKLIDNCQVSRCRTISVRLWMAHVCNVRLVCANAQCNHRMFGLLSGVPFRCQHQTWWSNGSSPYRYCSFAVMTFRKHLMPERWWWMSERMTERQNDIRFLSDVYINSQINDHLSIYLRSCAARAFFGVAHSINCK